MHAKTMFTLFTLIWKLLVSALAFVVGMMVGGMIATTLGMQAPVLPPELDVSRTMVIMFATSPLLVLALYFLNRELAGGWWARSAMLFWLSWIAYSVNNVIEAAIFSSYATAPWFTLVNFLPALLLSAAAVAWLFPAHGSAHSLRAVWQAHFQPRTAGDWTWRFLLAAVVFMPIYYGFGLLVVPFVGDYYLQGAFGLAQPTLPTLLLVLLARSVLFLVAALPILVAWQGTARSLFLRLGFALFVMVGLLYMLAATWMVPQMRVIHSLEILADSLVYAGALVWLLMKPRVERQQPPRSLSQTANPAS